MSPRRTLAIAAVASAALHLGPLALVIAVPRLVTFRAPVPIELLAYHPPAASAIAPSGEAEVKAARPSTPGGSAPSRPPRKRRPKPRVARPLDAPPDARPSHDDAATTPAPTDIGRLAPGAEARIVLILRTDRLRGSPYRTAVQTLLEALPDARTLLAGTGLRPVDDFDALLIATSNPYDVTATFLAARHADDPRLRAALSRRTIPPWDPRQIRYVDPHLSVLARPDAAARIDGASVGPDDASAVPRAVTEGGARGEGDGPRDAGTVATPAAADARWLGELRHFDRLADEPGAPALLLTVSNLHELVAVGGGFPTPRLVALAAGADESPRVRVRLAFATERDGAQFEASWPELLRRWRSSTMLLGLGGLLDGFAVERRGAVVDVTGRVSDGEVRLALGLAVALLPKPAAAPDDANGASRTVDARSSTPATVDAGPHAAFAIDAGASPPAVAPPARPPLRTAPSRTAPSGGAAPGVAPSGAARSGASPSGVAP